MYYFDIAESGIEEQLKKKNIVFFIRDIVRVWLLEVTNLAVRLLLPYLKVWLFCSIYNWTTLFYDKIHIGDNHRPFSALVSFYPTDMKSMMAESTELSYKKGVLNPRLNSILVLIDINKFARGGRCVGSFVRYSLASLYCILVCCFLASISRNLYFPLFVLFILRPDTAPRKSAMLHAQTTTKNLRLFTAATKPLPLLLPSKVYKST